MNRVEHESRCCKPRSKDKAVKLFYYRVLRLEKNYGQVVAQ